MDFLLNTQEEQCRMEVYAEYLKKIPQLLQQLQTVETMCQKAVMEEAMLEGKDPMDPSVALYADRLARTKEQCLLRGEDIKGQCRLIFALKEQFEQESTALQALMRQD